MAEMIIQRATVSGSGAFPLDMLRYDSCYPATQADVAMIMPITFPGGCRYIVVERVQLAGYESPWTKERWASFGWKLTEDSEAIIAVEELAEQQRQQTEADEGDGTVSDRGEPAADPVERANRARQQLHPPGKYCHCDRKGYAGYRRAGLMVCFYCKKLIAQSGSEMEIDGISRETRKQIKDYCIERESAAESAEAARWHRAICEWLMSGEYGVDVTVARVLTDRLSTSVGLERERERR